MKCLYTMRETKDNNNNNKKLGSKTVYHSVQIKFTCNLISAKQSYLTDPLGLILTGFGLYIF